MGLVIDMATRRPLEEVGQTLGFVFDFRARRREQLVFDVDPMPGRMVRIGISVPGDCIGIIMDACRDALIANRKVKPKPDRRRRVAK